MEGCLYGPFGDVEGCTPGYDYTETHFTDKLRDQESVNDYFGARYFSSVLGRFMSPDWSSTPEAVPYADLMNPQSLNLYAYVNNNPLSRVDKDGHAYICIECAIAGATAYITSPEGRQTMLGAGKITLGGALIATTALGDAPGGAVGGALSAA